nr:MAG TPA: hypothetical protein [Caudoviricetes sp.]
MENKETEKRDITLAIGEAIGLNDILNKAKFTDVSNDAMGAILEFKFALSKINKDKDEFIKESAESIKDDNFKELQEKQNKTKEEEKQFEEIMNDLNKKLNEIVNKYFFNETTISITPIDKDEFFKFCKMNEFKAITIEFLYDKIVK